MRIFVYIDFLAFIIDYFTSDQSYDNQWKFGGTYRAYARVAGLEDKVAFDCHIVCKNHSWNSGKVTKPATCTVAGVKTYTCTVNGCGKTKTETIKKKGHNYSTTYTVDKKATASAAGSKSKHCS